MTLGSGSGSVHRFGFNEKKRLLRVFGLRSGSVQRHVFKSCFLIMFVSGKYDRITLSRKVASYEKMMINRYMQRNSQYTVGLPITEKNKTKN